MPRKRKEEDDAGTAPEQVTLTVTAEHIATPHSIELRRKGGEFVVEAQMNDHAHQHVIGAMTVEDILRTNGLPFPEGKRDVVLVFSPHNGEIISGAFEDGKPQTEVPPDAPATDAPSDPPADSGSGEDKTD
jgi:hypothetical protein